jgi:hypothetical protein
MLMTGRIEISPDQVARLKRAVSSVRAPVERRGQVVMCQVRNEIGQHVTLARKQDDETIILCFDLNLRALHKAELRRQGLRNAQPQTVAPPRELNQHTEPFWISRRYLWMDGQSASHGSGIAETAALLAVRLPVQTSRTRRRSVQGTLHQASSAYLSQAMAPSSRSSSLRDCTAAS